MRYKIGKRYQLKYLRKFQKQVESMNKDAREINYKAKSLSSQYNDRKQIIKFGRKLNSVGNGYSLQFQDSEDSYFSPYISCVIKNKAGEIVAMVLDDIVGDTPSQWTLRFEKQVPLKDLNGIIELVSSHNEFHV